MEKEQEKEKKEEGRSSSSSSLHGATTELAAAMFVFLDERCQRIAVRDERA